MSSWYGEVFSALGKSLSSPEAVGKIAGATIGAVGGYFLQKDLAKKQASMMREQMRHDMDLLKYKDELQSKYLEVPEVDTSYRSLTVDEAPNLANGGILTEMKKRSDEKKGFV